MASSCSRSSRPWPSERRRTSETTSPAPASAGENVDCRSAYEIGKGCVTARRAGDRVEADASSWSCDSFVKLCPSQSIGAGDTRRHHRSWGIAIYPSSMKALCPLSRRKGREPHPPKSVRDPCVWTLKSWTDSGDVSELASGRMGRWLDAAAGEYLGSRPMRIGILGGTGPAGSSLGARPGVVGFEVVIGSRSKYRAMEVGRPPDRAVARPQPRASTPATTTPRPRPTSSSSPRRGTPPRRRPRRSRRSSRARSSSRWPTPSPRSATSSSRSCRPAGRWPPSVQAAVPRVPRRRRPAPRAGQGARRPRRADRERRADLLRPPRGHRDHAEIVARSRPAARSTPASCRRHRRSRRSRPCSCS